MFYYIKPDTPETDSTKHIALKAYDKNDDEVVDGLRIFNGDDD